MFYIFLMVVAAIGVGVYLTFIFQNVPGVKEERLGRLEPLPAEEEVSARIYHHTQDLESHGRVEVLEDMSRYDAERLHLLITRHARFTGSARAAEILADWKKYCAMFRKVMPVEYRRALVEMQKARTMQAAE